MLSILKSALNANTKEIGIVSNNIANVNSTAFKKSKTKDKPINISDPKINKTIRRFKTEILMYLLFILGS